MYLVFKPYAESPAIYYRFNQNCVYMFPIFLRNGICGAFKLFPTEINQLGCYFPPTFSLVLGMLKFLSLVMLITQSINSLRDLRLPASKIPSLTLVGSHIPLRLGECYFWIPACFTHAHKTCSFKLFFSLFLSFTQFIFIFLSCPSLCSLPAQLLCSSGAAAAAALPNTAINKLVRENVIPSQE